jgi:hypothetical protein
MKRLSGQMKAFANSVVVKAGARERMMAVFAVAVVAMSVAEILSRKEQSNPHATSIGCDPEVFRHRLARAISDITIPATEPVGAAGA